MASAPEIPLDFKEMLHDCILAVFWPKAKIVEFFRNVDCPGSILDTLNTTGEYSLSRHEIIVEVFSQLSSRDDRGYKIFQLMIDRMVNWNYFDPFWFEEKAKLDKAEAQQKISLLKRTLKERNASTGRQKHATAKSNTRRRESQDLSVLKKAFTQLYGDKLTPQARGKFFEKFLQEIFNQQSIRMGEAFRIVGEEIDGSFKFEGENYIVEAKWQDASSSTGQLYKFAHKVDGKMHGRGVFISVNGFSNEAIKAVVHGKHIKTMLIDGADLNFVLEGLVSLTELLDYKIRAAQTRGEVYVCAVEKKAKL